jgi:hypothetical protein
MALSSTEVRELVHRLSNDLAGAYSLLDYLVATRSLSDSLTARATESLVGLEDARQYLAALGARQAASPQQPPPADAPG